MVVENLLLTLNREVPLTKLGSRGVTASGHQPGQHGKTSTETFSIIMLVTLYSAIAIMFHCMSKRQRQTLTVRARLLFFTTMKK